MALTANFPDIVGNLGVNGFSGGNRARAAEINANVLEPLLYLKARPVLVVQDLDGTILSTSSTSFVTITGMSGSITTSRSSKLAIWASFHWIQTGAPSTCYATVSIDGVDAGHATNGLMANSGATTTANMASFSHLTAALSDGAHTIALRGKCSSGSIDFKMATLIAMEVN